MRPEDPLCDFEDNIGIVFCSIWFCIVVEEEESWVRCCKLVIFGSKSVDAVGGAGLAVDDKNDEEGGFILEDASNDEMCGKGRWEVYDDDDNDDDDDDEKAAQMNVVCLRMSSAGITKRLDNEWVTLLLDDMNEVHATVLNEGCRDDHFWNKVFCIIVTTSPTRNIQKEIWKKVFLLYIIQSILNTVRWTMGGFFFLQFVLNQAETSYILYQHKYEYKNGCSRSTKIGL